MNKIIRSDILYLLSKAEDDIRRGDLASLRELSNHTIHNSSIFQDPDSTSVAVILYATAKIIERSSEAIEERILVKLKKAHEALQSNRLSKYRTTIKSMFEHISKLDKKMNLYVEEVIEQAKIRKGSKIYEHGISLARTAEILGISQWEIMPYIANLKSTAENKPSDIRSRLNSARRLFRQ